MERQGFLGMVREPDGGHMEVKRGSSSVLTWKAVLPTEIKKGKKERKV